MYLFREAIGWREQKRFEIGTCGWMQGAMFEP